MLLEVLSRPEGGGVATPERQSHILSECKKDVLQRVVAPCRPTKAAALLVISRKLFYLCCCAPCPARQAGTQSAPCPPVFRSCAPVLRTQRGLTFLKVVAMMSIFIEFMLPGRSREAWRTRTQGPTQAHAGSLASIE